MGIQEIFAEEAVYIESWGPEYHGAEKIKLWFDEWNTRGTVLAWKVKQFFHIEAFEGMSLIQWTEDNRICFLTEFGCNENRYDPCQDDTVPKFRDEKVMWF